MKNRLKTKIANVLSVIDVDYVVFSLQQMLTLKHAHGHLSFIVILHIVYLINIIYVFIYRYQHYNMLVYVFLIIVIYNIL